MVEHLDDVQLLRITKVGGDELDLAMVGRVVGIVAGERRSGVHSVEWRRTTADRSHLVGVADVVVVLGRNVRLGVLIEPGHRSGTGTKGRDVGVQGRFSRELEGDGLSLSAMLLFSVRQHTQKNFDGARTYRGWVGDEGRLGSSRRMHVVN